MICFANQKGTFENVDSFKKALRSLSGSIGLISDSELLGIWSEVSSNGSLSSGSFSTLYANLRARHKRRLANGVAPNVSDFNEVCDGKMSPFDVLKTEGINIDLTSLEKVLSENGETMASTELYDILASCPGIEGLLQNGDMEKALKGLRYQASKKVPSPSGL